MKGIILMLVTMLVPFISPAQDCAQAYTFDASDKATYSTTCGMQEGKYWMVNKNSCNFYTPLTTVGGKAGDAAKIVDLKLRLANSGNLNEKDFAWIFYYVNGKIEVTKTIRGDQAAALLDFKDSIAVPAGGNFKLRIAFVCDEQDEFWRLGSGDLSLCVRAVGNEPVVEAPSAPDLISLVRERDIIKLFWHAMPSPSGNYFMIERSKNGIQFEFAGYVKDNRTGNTEAKYSFIDAGAFKTETWYRIMQVDMKGKNQPFGAIVSVK